MMNMSMEQLRDAEMRTRSLLSKLDDNGKLENLRTVSVRIDATDLAAIVWLLDTAREFAELSNDPRQMDVFAMARLVVK